MWTPGHGVRHLGGVNLKDLADEIGLKNLRRRADGTKSTGVDDDDLVEVAQYEVEFVHRCNDGAVELVEGLDEAKSPRGVEMIGWFIKHQ